MRSRSETVVTSYASANGLGQSIEFRSNIALNRDVDARQVVAKAEIHDEFPKTERLFENPSVFVFFSPLAPLLKLHSDRRRPTETKQEEYEEDGRLGPGFPFAAFARALPRTLGHRRFVRPKHGIGTLRNWNLFSYEPWRLKVSETEIPPDSSVLWSTVADEPLARRLNYRRERADSHSDATVLDVT